jgi:D-alanine-D-alanine ligase
MRVLLLHSDVAPGAPADDQDTLVQAAEIEKALQEKGHAVSRAAFKPDRAALSALITREHPDIVFNLVEAVWGRGSYASLAVTMLTELGVAYTGTDAAAMAIGGDKLLTKRLLVSAGLPTPQWAVAPDWKGVNGGRWIVKSVDEDSSLGLDDDAVASGRAAVLTRAEQCATTHGGRWFAESYVEGREFHVAVIEKNGAPHVLPVAEMVFENWEKSRLRIMGATAKWDSGSPEFNRTVWKFDGVAEPTLHAKLAGLALRAFELLGLSGYARVDFRVDKAGNPFILEINPNPSLALNCGLTASAAAANMSYADLIESILRAGQRH